MILLAFRFIRDRIGLHVNGISTLQYGFFTVTCNFEEIREKHQKTDHYFRC